MARCHINFLELRAAFLSLRSINPRTGSHIHFVMDNAATVGCIKRSGSRSPILNIAMQQIVSLKDHRGWFLSASHL